MIQLFWGGPCQKLQWLFNLWDPKICCFLRINIWIELIILMLIVLQKFLVRLISYSLPFICQCSAAVVLLAEFWIYFSFGARLLFGVLGGIMLSLENLLNFHAMIVLVLPVGVVKVLGICWSNIWLWDPSSPNYLLPLKWFKCLKFFYFFSIFICCV